MTKNKSAIWSFFSSVQLAIVLLSLIAFFAVIGTLVPQREAAAELAARLSPGLFAFLQKMQIFDLYHSIWFFLLMALLAVNLIDLFAGSISHGLAAFPICGHHRKMKKSLKNFRKKTIFR